MNRELSRRLSRLEADQGSTRVRYIVSDRPLTEAEWHASKDDDRYDFDELDGLAPILTEAEWVERFCV
ncbi:hypothetical protein [Bosea sp. PAMC 26642]|uniref:hypothetical protein n=1 Tax=Bosea sp. (strain PAMC 26642) TaxID=1792307 RepID=UPI00076FE0A0|nr:hypothetical protein [Bosea sp. PAMC 26642]AMJ59375.1 hypothetical protein AXW83_02810 [Bosea sp. PAMC 26642]